ncbi:hypothetical protein [Gemella sp. zg-1178]|uniref:hypothetical protein n=1 Tax=Gemella sp. zg-1178 TaxID=2840372 RepID=UPI001C04C9FD|nr:hypothetical protein [Gemella sp. zg-1178]MBU0279223.1 hypothetical protein [Gemella sp. zg-1178]
MLELIVTALTVLIAPVSLAVLNHILKGREKSLERVAKSVSRIEEAVDKTAQGTRAILSYRLIKDMRGALHAGFTTVDKVQEVAELYESYENLGGNSVVSTLFIEYKNLPLKRKGG